MAAILPMHVTIIIITIIKSLFSEDYILSTGTYLTYDPLNIKSLKHIYKLYTFIQGNNWYQRLGIIC